MVFQGDYTPKPGDEPDSPIITVKITNPEDTTKKEKLSFLIDSGASWTVLRGSIYDRMKFQYKGDIPLITAKDTEVEEYEFSFGIIEIPGFFNGLEEKLKIIRMDGAHNLLGRNFLNQFCLVLNGFTLEYKFVKEEERH